MAKKKRDGAAPSQGKEVGQILDILGRHVAAQQNEIIGEVIKELKLNRLGLVKASQDNLNDSQGAIAALSEAVQTALQASLPEPSY